MGEEKNRSLKVYNGNEDSSINSGKNSLSA